MIACSAEVATSLEPSTAVPVRVVHNGVAVNHTSAPGRGSAFERVNPDNCPSRWRSCSIPGRKAIDRWLDVAHRVSALRPDAVRPLASDLARRGSQA